MELIEAIVVSKVMAKTKFSVPARRAHWSSF